MSTRIITFVDGFTSETIPTAARAGTQGPAGVNGIGISTIVRTSGNGAAGTVDTYTITFTNSTTSIFQITNGADGTNGIDGQTLRFGNGAPTNSLGSDGEFYIDQTNSRLYGPKASGVWPSSFVSLIGPEGRSIVSAAFVGNDIVFTDNVGMTVTLTDAATTLKGDKGDTGDSGTLLNVNAANTTFTPVNRQLFNVSASGAFNVQLPAPSANFTFIIKDVLGNFASNNVTLVRNGSEMIEGLAASRILETDFGAWTIYSDGTNWFLL